MLSSTRLLILARSISNRRKGGGATGCDVRLICYEQIEIDARAEGPWGTEALTDTLHSNCRQLHSQHRPQCHVTQTNSVCVSAYTQPAFESAFAALTVCTTRKRNFTKHRLCRQNKTEQNKSKQNCKFNH